MNESETSGYDLPDYNHTEQQEYEEWLAMLEKQKVTEIEKHLKRNFEEILAKQAEGGTNGINRKKA